MRRVFGIYTCDEVGWWLYPRTPVAQGGKTCFELGLGAGSSRLHAREYPGQCAFRNASRSDVRYSSWEKHDHFGIAWNSKVVGRNAILK